MSTRLHEATSAEEAHRLEQTFSELLGRLDRVLTALALTADAQAAFVRAMSELDSRDMARVATTIARLEAQAERYRHALHALRDQPASD